MRWPWNKRPPPLAIPPYQVPVSKRETAEPTIVVEEINNVDDGDIEALRAAQTQTGMHRVWRRLTGQDPSA